MSGREFVAEPDRWTLPRRQTFGLRGHRVLPGPLKTLSPRRRSPIWLAGVMGFGLAGLAFAALTLAPRPASTVSSEPVSVHAAPAVLDLPAPRVVGAAPAPAAPPVAAALPTPEPPALRKAVTEPEAVPAPPQPPAIQRPAVPPLDIGQLPVLELEASAFEPAPVAEAPRPPTKPHARTPAPRLAPQP